MGSAIQVRQETRNTQYQEECQQATSQDRNGKAQEEEVKFTVHNSTPYDRWSWIDIPVPLLPAGQNKFRILETGWPVYRSIDVGIHTTLLHAQGLFPRAALGAYSLVPDDPDAASKDPVFSLTDWILDNPNDLIPHPFVVDASGLHRNVESDMVEALELNGVRQVFHRRCRIQGTPIVFDAYAYIYSLQDVVKLTVTFTCSDPRNPQTIRDYLFSEIGIISGEQFIFNFRNTFKTPVGHKLEDGSIRHALLLNKTIADGQQLRFSGVYACLPTKPGAFLNLSDPVTKIRLDSIYAEMEEPIEVWSDWNNAWGAFNRVPKVPVTTTVFSIPKDQDFYAYRGIGATKTPSQTGGQEDFGACKAGPWHRGWREYLRTLDYAASDAMRGFHNREADGSPVKFVAHPKLLTWNQRPFKLNTDTDTLGKTDFAGKFPPDLNGTRFQTFDDQHRSQNNFNALYALTGNYDLKQVLDDFLQMDLAQVPGRMDSPRAVGRLFLAWANMLELLPPVDATTLRAHVLRRHKVVLDNWKGGKLDESLPIRVLDIGTDPDLVETVPDPANPGKFITRRVLAWIVWEHSIAAMGYAALARTMPIAVAADFQKMATHLANLVTNYGCFFDGSSWRCLTAVRYLLGAEEGTPIQTYSLISKDIRIHDGFWTWVFPAVLLADPSVRRTAIMDQISHEHPATWEQSEWWAV